MSDSRRTWLRWAGTVIGVALAAFGLRTTLVTSAVSCRAGSSAYVCRASGSDHPHVLLGIAAFVIGLGIVGASRHYFSYFGR